MGELNLKNISVLVVEDDPISRMSLVNALQTKNINVTSCSSSIQAKKIIQQERMDLAFIDLNLEDDLAGLGLIELCNARMIYVVVVSGVEEDHIIDKSYDYGCKDFLLKPFSPDSLNLVLKRYTYSLESKFVEKIIFEQFITNDKLFLSKIKSVINSSLSGGTILIQGETGTGKTKLAKLIHKITLGDAAPFVHLNCSELSENLQESELFGHIKGAFSGATSNKWGKLKLADGGTLFLDELGSMPTSLQQKLLNAIEEKSFFPVGSDQIVYSNFKIISATSDNLQLNIKEGIFREDLYYRLEGHNFILAPLRERKKDLRYLVKHFLSTGMRRVTISEDVSQAFENYRWPGNIRELKKLISILQMSHTGKVTIDDLPIHILNTGKTDDFMTDGLNQKALDLISEIGLKKYLKQVENEIVQHCLKKNNFMVRKTISELKLSNNSYYKISSNKVENEARNE